ncbi:MAG: sodium:proton exchanger [Spirochaetes bacterium GWB1_48_6]|nr:MAG: sodium:proton exchanger [Spirochaetes bacterium GWB1_48_6]
MAWVVLIGGFVPLIYGADWLVEGGSSLAKRFNVPILVIGLTIVAFGTSAPELVVNIFSATSGSTDLAVGNILGSNIFNILLILGVSALIYPLKIKNSTTWIEIPLALLSGIVVFLLLNDTLIDQAPWSGLGRVDGLILLGFFIIFLAYTGTLALKGNPEESLQIKNRGLGLSLGMVGLGLVLLVFGGKLIVDGATSVARGFGLSERLIGLTIVAAGTSLPELATSAVAAFKKNTDIAVGNIVGSNLFNAFFVLGSTAVISPLKLNPLSNLDLVVNILATLLLIIFVFSPRGRSINRIEGGIFVALYLVYSGYLVVTA